MKLWRVHELGDPADVLRLEDGEPPEPGPGEVRVRVDACGLNFPDILLCQGKYQEKPPLPFTPGMEVAGTIVGLGGDLDLAVGDRVVGAPPIGHGGLAEETVLTRVQALPLPDSVSSDDAAASFITYQTAYVGLHRRAGLREGETLLVHAGAGGVGSAAIQIGKAAGAMVVATAGGPERTQICRDLGADIAIDYSAGDLVAQVKEATNGWGAHVIWDPVGGDVFDASTKCIAYDGRLIVVGFAGGRIPTVNAGHVLVKSYSVVGLHWGLMIRRQPEVLTEAHEALMDLFSDGVVQPLIDSAVPMADVPAALDRLANRKVTGKVVVHPGE